jgi:hypothetical protein
MLTELCGYLKNWFVVDMIFGDFIIADGHITNADGIELPLQVGQHFRIIGSIFNDGVHKNGEATLQDESFNGTVWTMAIPKDLLEIADEITAWRAKYEGADSAALSPFTSESFGGYSYSKSGGNAADSSNGTSWQSVFGNRLNRYRKV